MVPHRSGAATCASPYCGSVGPRSNVNGAVIYGVKMEMMRLWSQCWGETPWTALHVIVHDAIAKRFSETSAHIERASTPQRGADAQT